MVCVCVFVCVPVCVCVRSCVCVCVCAGVELLLDEVYDTVFSGPVLGRSFSQTNMYRILSRRFLALLAALTGSFRCTLQSLSYTTTNC